MNNGILFDYLNRDPVLHADMLDALEQEDCDILYADEDGALLYNIATGTYLASPAEKETAQAFAKRIGDTDFVSVHGERFHEYFANKHCRPFVRRWIPAAYLKKTPVAIDRVFDIRPLTREHLPTVLKYYKAVDDAVYVEARLLSGMIGAFDGDKLMGFIGTHDSGELGLLVTLPEYRNRGVAYALEATITNQYVAEGRVSYGIILPDNSISRDISLAIGYTVSDDFIVWHTSSES